MGDHSPLRRDAVAYGAIALAALCWSGNHVLGRAIAGHIPPVAISMLRWAIPALILLPFALPHLRRDARVLRDHIWIIAVLATMGGAIFGTLQYVGLQYTTAINVSVLNSVAPVFIIAAGLLMFGDAVSGRQIVGIAISLTGVLAIVAKGDPGVLAGLDFNWGDLIILFNQGIFAVYSAYLRLRPKIHWLSFTFAMAAISALVTAPAMIVEHWAGYRMPWTWETLAVIGYVSIFPSVVATIAWIRGVDLIGQSRAGALLHLIAIFSAVLASLLLGERLMPFHFAGFGLILCGVWLAAHKADP